MVTNCYLAVDTAESLTSVAIRPEKVSDPSDIEEGRIDKTVPVYFSTDDTSDIGQGWGTPMSDTYEPPFAFTGKVKNVTVQAKSP